MLNSTNNANLIDFDCGIYMDPTKEKEGYYIKGLTREQSLQDHYYKYKNFERADYSHLMKESRHQVIRVCEDLAFQTTQDPRV